MGSKFYLPGLNGIRAIAALIVIIFHIDQYSSYFGLESIGFYKNGMARYGVTLFFVLSGYLITYLLLIEKDKFGKIDFPKFYTRRILRIWPPYYMCILLTLVILFTNRTILGDHTDIATTILLYSLFLPNVGFAFGFQLTPITPLWSVGVEEQFYAFWPLLIQKSKRLLLSLVLVILIYLIVKISLRIFENGDFYNLIKYSLFSAMAIGGIGALLVFNKSSRLRIIYHPVIQLIAWGVLIGSIFYKPLQLISIIDHEINAVLYIIIIMNVSTNPKTIIRLENRVLDFIGKISYGIYVYHMLIVLGISWLIKDKLQLKFQSTVADYAIVYSVVISLTLAISLLSFTYFEKFFLRMKTRFAKIESTNSKTPTP